MVKRFVVTAILCVFAAFFVLSAQASLTPMYWGFPVMTQHQTLDSMNLQFANSTALQDSAVSFPTVSTDTTGSILGSAFPTILQTGTGDQTQMSLSTMNETADSQFAYPWFSMGGSPVPSMGML